MYHKSKLWGVMLLIAFFGIAPQAKAQVDATTSKIIGSVTDEQGAAIGGVSIQARNVDTFVVREVTTQDNGSFSILGLAPGTYEVKLMAEGFKPQVVRADVQLGINTRFTTTLAVGAQTQDVVEVTSTYTINEGQTESSNNIDRGFIVNIPINRRNFLDFVLTSPRVVRDRAPITLATASGFSTNGQSSRLNVLNVDGLQNSDANGGGSRATFSQDAVQEFQVNLDGFSPEFGRSLGASVNIITKTGTNEFHGTLFGFLRNDDLSARPAFSNINPEFKQYQVGSNLSGPIKKDKAIFLAAFERLSVRDTGVVTISNATLATIRKNGFPGETNGPIPFSVASSTFLGRIDIKPFSNDTINLRYNYSNLFNGSAGVFGGLRSYSGNFIQTTKETVFAVANNYISSGGKFLNSSRFQFSPRLRNTNPIEQGPNVSLVAPEGTINLGRNVNTPQIADAELFQFANTTTFVFNKHQLKFGVDVYRERREVVSTTQLNGVATFGQLNLTSGGKTITLTGLQAFDPSLRTPEQRAFLMGIKNNLFPAGFQLANVPIPSSYVQAFGNPLQVGYKLKIVDGRQIDDKVGLLFVDQFSSFVQDEIKLRPNLLLKAGIRFDHNNIDPLSPKSNNNFGPRLALAYQPGFVKGLSLRAHYGIYYGTPLTSALFATAHLAGDEIFQVITVPSPLSAIPYSLPGRRFPQTQTAPSDFVRAIQLTQTGAVDQNLEDPYAQQTGLGVDYRPNSNATISLTYVFVRGIHLPGVRQINPIIKPVIGNATQSQLTGRLNPKLGGINEVESGFDSYYHGFTTSLTYKLTKRLDITAHYTFSKTIDSVIDAFNNVQEKDNSLDIRSERGLALVDARSRFVTTAIWNIDYTKNPFLNGFQLSSIVSLNSGQPYNLLAPGDINLDGNDGDRPRIGGVPIGRNAGITPGFANVDLRLTKSVSIKERVRIKTTFEAFNLFNRVNIDPEQINRTFLQDAQGKFILPARDENGKFVLTSNRFRGSFPQRRLQVGFRVEF